MTLSMQSFEIGYNASTGQYQYCMNLGNGQCLVLDPATVANDPTLQALGSLEGGILKQLPPLPTPGLIDLQLGYSRPPVVTHRPPRPPRPLHTTGH